MALILSVLAVEAFYRSFVLGAFRSTYSIRDTVRAVVSGISTAIAGTASRALHLRLVTDITCGPKLFRFLRLLLFHSEDLVPNRSKGKDSSNDGIVRAP